MNTPNVPIKAICSGVLEIGNSKIPCHVLEDETRVFSQTQMINALGMSPGGNVKIGHDRLARFTIGKSIKPFISDELTVLIQNPIKFIPSHGGRTAYGYSATILADICEAVLKAEEEGTLQTQQQHIADQCKILVRGFAKVGIVALVDEVTGYQYSRPRDALRQLIELYIEEELQKWMKTFSDSFFAALDRLYENDKTTSRNRPKYYGKFINTYIYNPLEKGFVKRELDKRNITDKGKRRARFHQWLSEHGRTQLVHQIGRVQALMEISGSLNGFKSRFKKLTQPSLFDRFEIDD